MRFLSRSSAFASELEQPIAHNQLAGTPKREYVNPTELLTVLEETIKVCRAAKDLQY